jgi:hypothetical protein
MNKLTKIAGVLLLAFAANAGHAALNIIGSAQGSYNFALSTGAILPNGAIFQVGYYSSSLSASYFSGLTSASQFETNWTSIASSTANQYDYAGLRAASLALGDGINTYQGKTLSILVGNAGTIASSTQVGVFSNADWIVPTNTAAITPTDFGIDVADTGTVALFGSLRLGEGAYPPDAVNSANLAPINLAAVPEPSVASLFALGTVGLVALRARRKS